MNVPRLRHIPCELAQNFGRVRSRRWDNLGRSQVGRTLEGRLEPNLLGVVVSSLFLKKLVQVLAK